tara:strand:+ start:218 stop:592 length:375 start_codon:yes stop_codon:yes gene_type:complete
MNQNKQSDGRVYTNWLPAGELNKNIRIKNNIKTNKDYRAYLVNNADKIIDFNQRQSVAEVSYSPYYRNYAVVNSNTDINTGVNVGVNEEESDLKKLYLSRNDINKRYNTPVVGQETLLAFSNPN